MANPPLQEAAIYKGVIYLKGETAYPNEVFEALDKKQASVKKVAESPIFQAPRADAPVQALDHSSGLVIPAPTPPPAPATEVPEDFPYRELFEASGYTSIEGIMALNGDYESVSGIGPQRAEEVRVHLDENYEVGG